MDYTQQKDKLKLEIKNLLDDKQVNEANKKMDELESLEMAYAKEMTAAANMAAFQMPEYVDLKAKDCKIQIERKEDTMSNELKIFSVDSAEYRMAWIKNLQGKELSTDEMVAMDSGSSSAGAVIPTVTQNKIIEKMIKLAPMIGEVDLMQIPGYVKIPVESTVNDAALHTENAAITASGDTLTYISLAGFEICKTLQISATVQTMSIDAFEDWITSNIARSMANPIENYIINGTGSSQPKGADAAETWTDGTNAVQWASSSKLADADITELISLLPARYDANAKFLINKKTFWQQVMPIRDDSKYKIVTETADGYLIHGYPVLHSDKVADNVFFLADWKEAIKANLSRPINIESDKSAGFTSNSIIWRGDCIFDCAPVPGSIVKSAATIPSSDSGK